jgi:hypothetical protein
MWKNKCIALCALLMVLALPGISCAELITVGNPSFESPNVLADPYYAFQIDGWNTYMGNEGVIANNNIYGDNLANCDGSQVAFLPAYATNWAPFGLIYQDLTTTLEAGYTYTLTIGAGLFTHEADAPGATMECRLHYRQPDDPSAAPAAATTTIAWEQLIKTELREFSASITVKPGDDCVGKTMGISFWGAGNGPGADFALDNVRLTATPVPEPSSVVLALSAIAGLLVCVRRYR